MRLKYLLFIVLIFVFALTSFGCKPDDNTNPNGNDISNPTLNLTIKSYTLVVGDDITLDPVIANTEEELDLSYISADSSIASVDNNGKIVALKEGETNITVSLKDYPDITILVSIVVTDEENNDEPLSLTGPDSVYVAEVITLTATDSTSDNNLVLWQSTTPDIVRVDQSGNVTGLKEGEGVIRIYSNTTGDWVEKQILVIVPDPESVEIGDVTRRITYSSVVKLVAEVSPKGANQEVTWFSEDEDICTIDETGRLTPIMPGEVTINATVKGTDMVAKITINIDPTLMEFLERHNNENPLVQDIRVFGYEAMFTANGGYFMHNLIGSVNNYLDQDLVIKESILGVNYGNRPGTIMTEVKYITVHDTGSAAPGANAYMHDGYIHGGAQTAQTSWHYTVGNDGIYHHLPDNEVAWHAGDGTTVPYEAFDSKVPYTREKKPEVTITPDGYYALDGIKSVVKAPNKVDKEGVNYGIPTTSDINTLGIEVTKGTNGNWYIGKTWWSETYKYVGNRGGNNNSIGIESCVNQGSDIFLTWQLLAKVVAKLMIENNLGFEHIVQHHYFSGKDCPMTMRNSNNFEMFLKLVEAEYIIRTKFSDYTIEFQSNNPTYINNNGRIFNLPTTATRASYMIKITHKETNAVETKLFYVNLPAKTT